MLWYPSVVCIGLRCVSPSVYRMTRLKRRWKCTICLQRRSRTSRCWAITPRSCVRTLMLTGWLPPALLLLIPMNVSSHNACLSLYYFIMVALQLADRQPLCFSPDVSFLFFYHFFRRLVDRRQTLPRVRLWLRFIKLGQKFFGLLPQNIQLLMRFQTT